jgi:insulysin
MKNIQNDGWRLEQVAKETSNPSHPFHKFGTGNLKTLKEDPAKQQLDVRDQLLQFHNRHYFAQQMRLAVLGKDSIDTLEQWVRKYFSAIESKSEADLDSYNKSLLTPEAAGPVRLPHQRGVVIEIVPIKDLRSLSLSWFVKPMRQHYRLKPFQYIGGLLGHEGSGSVLSILRKKGWATSLSAGLEEESKYYSRFSVDVSLSEEGLVHVNEVSDLIFGYLSLLKTEKVQKWFWEENKKMSGLSWQFLEVSDNSGYVSSLASAMQYYDTKELLHHGFVYDKFDADLISSCVKMLSAEDVVQTIVSQKFDGNTSSKEQWYGTDYSMEKIDQARINQWEHAVVPKEMHVPKPNPFLPTDFTILAKGTRKIPLVLPTKFVDVVVEEPGLRVWHKLDDTFFTPRGIVFARVVMNEMKHDVKSRVSADLLIRLVNLALAEETYQGGLAGLGYGFSWSEDGLSFSFSGYTQHMGEWIERLMNKIPKCGSYQLSIESKRYTGRSVGLYVAGAGMKSTGINL